MPRQLYLDCDGVLADFDAGGAFVHHTSARETVEAPREYFALA